MDRARIFFALLGNLTVLRTTPRADIFSKGSTPQFPPMERVAGQDRTGGFLFMACVRLHYSLRNSPAFIILWDSQAGHSAHNTPRALLAYMCKLNFAVKLIR